MVINVFEHVRDTVYQLHIGATVIKTTSDHPFFIGGRWLSVKDLHVGDLVTTYAGKKLVISAIDIIAQRTTVHNFEVKDYHTYYVSEQRVLVHNNACDVKLKKLYKQAEKEYPNKVVKPDELHHIEPQYMGGAKNGKLSKIPAPYHAKITKAFRDARPYGRGPMTKAARQEIMKEVYKKLPLPN